MTASVGTPHASPGHEQALTWGVIPSDLAPEAVTATLTLTGLIH